jgi:hypothetical protein
MKLGALNNQLIVSAIKVEQNWPCNLDSEDLSDFEAERCYSTYDAYLTRYKSVWVTANAIVYNGLRLVKKSLPAKHYEKYYKLRYLVKQLLRSRKVKLASEKKYLLATDLWSTGHFHWLGDVLPKLYSIKDNCSDFVLLLEDTAYTRTIGLQTIRKMNLPFQDIVFLKVDEFYKIPELYYLSNISHSGRYHPALIQEVRNLLQSKNAAPAKSKVYISRKKAQYRKVLNESELIELLQRYNYEIVYAEDLDFSAQLEKFSATQVLISLHGAGLTNCIFMQPGTKVVEIRKKENGPHNVGYWHLSASLGQQYFYYNGKPDSDLSIVGRGCNVTIDLARFEEKILKNFSLTFSSKL